MLNDDHKSSAESWLDLQNILKAPEISTSKSLIIRDDDFLIKICVTDVIRVSL